MGSYAQSYRLDLLGKGLALEEFAVDANDSHCRKVYVEPRIDMEMVRYARTRPGTCPSLERNDAIGALKEGGMTERRLQQSLPRTERGLFSLCIRSIC